VSKKKKPKNVARAKSLSKNLLWRRRLARDGPPAGRRCHSSGLGSEAGRSWLAVIVIVAGLVAYWNSFDGQFVLDDYQRIIENEQIKHISPLWDLIAHSRRPVVTLSLAMNHAVGNLDVRGYHAFNLTIHILAALVLFGVVRRTLLCRRLRDRWGAAAPWLALACSLIWVVHPLQTQGVTYIIQRGESMMGLFYLLTLYCLVRGIDSSRRYLWYAGAIVVCALGMGCKAVMVTAPVIVLLYDRTFVAESFAQAFRRRWGLYLGLCATWLVLAASGVLGGVLASSLKGQATVGFGVRGITSIEYALTQPGVILHYLKLSIWPDPLCLDYMWPVARTPGQIVPPALVIAALLAATAWALLSRPALGFLGAWFFLILAPTTSFVPIQDIAFEHRMYLPLAAVVVLLVIGGARVLHDVSERLSLRPGAPRIVSIALLSILVLLLGYGTFQRNKDYHSTTGMWQDVLAHHPDHPRAHCGLGAILVSEGRLDEAVQHFNAAIQATPELAEAHFNMGVALCKQRRLEQAIKHYLEAIRLQPTMSVARKNLAVALREKGRFNEAAQQLMKVLEQDPRDATTHYDLGCVLLTQGKYNEASTHFAEALGLRPGLAEAHVNLGVALLRQGKLDEAIAQYTQALRLKPDLTNARENLKHALAARAKIGNADRRPREQP